MKRLLTLSIFVSAFAIASACAPEKPVRPTISKASLGRAQDAMREPIDNGKGNDSENAGPNKEKEAPVTNPAKEAGPKQNPGPSAPQPQPQPESEKPMAAINETGGSVDNNAITVPVLADDTGEEVDPFKAPRMLQSLSTSNCLDLDTNSNRNGEVIQGRPCAGTSGQMVEFKKLAGDLVTINFFASKGCFKLESGNLDKRTIVEQWKCSDDAAQKWKLERVAANTYVFHPAGNIGRCIDMDTNGPALRSTIQIYDCNGAPQQSFRLLRKDKAFVPKPQPVLSLDDMCHHKIREYQNDTNNGKLVYETLGGRFMDRIPEYAKMVCRMLYSTPTEVLSNITYMAAHIDGDIAGGAAFTVQTNEYKRATLKFSAAHYKSKADQGYEIDQFLKGTLIQSLTSVFQNPPSAKTSAKVKTLLTGLPFALQLQAGFADKGWKRDKSGAWDQGNLQSGLFLAFVEAKRPGFLKKLNKAVLTVADEAAFTEAAGTSADTMWTEYKNDAGCSATNLLCGK